MTLCRYCQSAHVEEYSPGKWKCSQCGRLKVNGKHWWSECA